MEPVNLQALALQAICTYMSQMCLRLVKLAHPASDGEVDVSQHDGVPVPKRRKRVQHICSSSEAEVTAICCGLKQVLQGDISPCFADYVTSEILRHVDDMYTQLTEYTKIPEGRLTVLRNFVAAILHPRVETLDLSFNWKHIADYVLCELQCVPNLRTLKFTSHKVHEGCNNDPNHIKFYRYSGLFSRVDHVRIGRCLSRLEHLTLEFECSDKMLQGLSETCSELKTLDINGSYRVTDASLEYIKKFTHLKILNLKRTKIKREAQINILSHLYKNNPCQLELYGCTDIDSSHLDTLVQLIPNIQELRSAFVNYDKSDPGSGCFHNLKILRIDHCREYSSHKWLSKYFPHLKELQITIDFMRLSEMQKDFPKLDKLFLRTNDFRFDHTFHYTSLEHLTLITCGSEPVTQTLISRCHNLKTLDIITCSSFYDSREHVLIQMPNLKEVSLGAVGGHVPPAIVALLSERCKTTVLLEDPKLSSLYERCPGVRVDTDRWLELTEPALSDAVMQVDWVTCHSQLFNLTKRVEPLDDMLLFNYDDDDSDLLSCGRRDNRRRRDILSHGRRGNGPRAAQVGLGRRW